MVGARSGRRGYGERQVGGGKEIAARDRWGARQQRGGVGAWRLGERTDERPGPIIIVSRSKVFKAGPRPR